MKINNSIQKHYTMMYVCLKNQIAIWFQVNSTCLHSVQFGYCKILYIYRHTMCVRSDLYVRFFVTQ